MEFAVSKGHGLGSVLVVMGECAVALSNVETENHKANGTGELLLEGTLLLMSDLCGT